MTIDLVNDVLIPCRRSLKRNSTPEQKEWMVQRIDDYLAQAEEPHRFQHNGTFQGGCMCGQPLNDPIHDIVGLEGEFTDEMWGQVYALECQADDELSQLAQRITYFFASNRGQDLFNNKDYVKSFRHIRRVLAERPSQSSLLEEARGKVQEVYDFYMGPDACGDFTCDCNKPNLCGICAIRVDVEDFLKRSKEGA